jgi:hypothetical protein
LQPHDQHGLIAAPAFFNQPSGQVKDSHVDGVVVGGGMVVVVATGCVVKGVVTGSVVQGLTIPDIVVVATTIVVLLDATPVVVMGASDSLASWLWLNFRGDIKIMEPNIFIWLLSSNGVPAPRMMTSPTLKPAWLSTSTMKDPAETFAFNVVESLVVVDVVTVVVSSGPPLPLPKLPLSFLFPTTEGKR